ncbi:MAG: hypothetical protein B7O98_04350 [Zestosphaera tikiterensis]|uniref:Uncharacterized protein n=1 Tax=Zestosphaera tikiterensis TaxID=1973259 RepID=A0A2R7Y7Z2_9CREN|nr:MAG: hypothetical protein B7O98_04350 [Zestosphaera tikiterensis]
MISWEVLGAWLGAALVVWIYSFVYRDNVFYKFAEHLFVGVAAGYSISLALDSLNRVAIKPLSTNPAVSWHYVIAIILGLLMFMKYSKKYYWLARYGVGVNIAVGTALALRTTPMANIVRQITATILPLWTPDPVTTLNNWLLVLITLGGLTYFLFTIFPKKPEAGKPSLPYYVYRVLYTIGIYGMMVGFGALFANTIMTRVGFLISIYLQYLQPNAWASITAALLAAIAIIAGIVMGRSRK